MKAVKFSQSWGPAILSTIKCLCHRRKQTSEHTLHAYTHTYSIHSMTHIGGQELYKCTHTLKIQNLIHECTVNACTQTKNTKAPLQCFCCMLLNWVSAFRTPFVVNQCTTNRRSVVSLKPYYHTTHASSDTIWNPIHTNSLRLYKVL